MTIITARNKDTNTYKCYSVDNAINGIEKAFRSNEWYDHHNDFIVEFNHITVLRTIYKGTTAITVISNDTTRETRNIQK